jgi:hypothetical protein
MGHGGWFVIGAAAVLLGTVHIVRGIFEEYLQDLAFGGFWLALGVLIFVVFRKNRHARESSSAG